MVSAPTVCSSPSSNTTSTPPLTRYSSSSPSGWTSPRCGEALEVRDHPDRVAVDPFRRSRWADTIDATPSRVICATLPAKGPADCSNFAAIPMFPAGAASSRARPLRSTLRSSLYKQNGWPTGSSMTRNSCGSRPSGCGVAMGRTRGAAESTTASTSSAAISKCSVFSGAPGSSGQTGGLYHCSALEVQSHAAGRVAHLIPAAEASGDLPPEESRIDSREFLGIRGVEAHAGQAQTESRSLFIATLPSRSRGRARRRHSL